MGDLNPHAVMNDAGLAIQSIYQFCQHTINSWYGNWTYIFRVRIWRATITPISYNSNGGNRTLDLRLIRPTLWPMSYIREVIVGFEPTITVLQTVVLTTWRYDPNVAYRTRTYNRKIRNLLHYPIMLMPQNRCDRIRTCIRRFWRPLHIHHAPHL